MQVCLNVTLLWRGMPEDCRRPEDNRRRPQKHTEEYHRRECGQQETTRNRASILTSDQPQKWLIYHRNCRLQIVTNGVSVIYSQIYYIRC